MIVLLNCSTSWCQNDTISSTGVVEQKDSLVLVPISALKVANAKMTELKYQKEINADLRKIINNDSAIISTLTQNVINNKQQAIKYKKQRNIVGCGGIGAILLLIISLL